MSALRALADGGYDFLEGVFPYSQGVIARDGFSLERARFPRPRPSCAHRGRFPLRASASSTGAM